ncbi:hypothetical protein BDR26DRAFT_972236 [Obelidium mucronatum]|nr:hypothetical protein BDR26DRAFT_972236 [Obelidium mucronatum]
MTLQVRFLTDHNTLPLEDTTPLIGTQASTLSFNIPSGPPVDPPTAVHVSIPAKSAKIPKAATGSVLGPSSGSSLGEKRKHAAPAGKNQLPKIRTNPSKDSEDDVVIVESVSTRIVGEQLVLGADHCLKFQCSGKAILIGLPGSTTDQSLHCDSTNTLVISMLQSLTPSELGTRHLLVGQEVSLMAQNHILEDNNGGGIAYGSDDTVLPEYRDCVDLITLFLGSHIHGGRGVPPEWTSVPKPEHMKLPAGLNSAELTNDTDVKVVKIVEKIFIKVAPVSKLQKMDFEDQVRNIHVAQLLFGFHSHMYLYCHAVLFCHKDSPRNMHHLSTDMMEKAVVKFIDEAKSVVWRFHLLLHTSFWLVNLLK